MQSIMSANVMTQSGHMTVWLPRLGGGPLLAHLRHTAALDSETEL
jgi:hypothetical protein